MEANSTRFKRTIRRILDFRYAVRFYAKPANKNMGDAFSYSDTVSLSVSGGGL